MPCSPGPRCRSPHRDRATPSPSVRGAPGEQASHADQTPQPPHRPSGGTSSGPKTSMLHSASARSSTGTRSRPCSAAEPDPRMYHHASDALGLSPSECLFVDADPTLVSAAIDLGYRGRANCRDGGSPPGDVPSITTLTEIVGVCCIERSEEILTGDLTGGTPPGASRRCQRGLAVRARVRWAGC